MEFTRTYFISVLKEFDEKFGQSDFMHRKTNFYPLIKLHYAYQLNLLYIKEKPASIGNNFIVKRKLNIARKLYYYFRIKLSGIKNIGLKKLNTSVLLVGFASNKTKISLFGKEEHLNPFITPFENLLKDCSVSFTSIDAETLLQTEQIRKLKSGFNFFQIVNSYRISNNNSLIFNLNEIEKFNEEKGITLPGLADFLFKNIAENEIQYYYWKQYLKAGKFSNILYYCYYDNNMLSLNRAAHDLKIPTIEYQHSLQSDNHFAYTKWNGNIKNGGMHFPSLFWVWTDLDKKRIENNFSQLEPTPKVIKGGNAYLALLHQKYSALIKRENDFVLIALQGFWIPDFIEEFIKSDEKMKWYLRLHPRYPSDKLKAEKLKEKFPDKIFIDEANNKSLYELLSKAKFTITAFSGVGLEAQAFGSQTIIFSEDGFFAYEEYIKEGAFLYVKEKMDLEIILNSQKFVSKDFNLLEIDPIKIKQNVIEIFGEKNEKYA